VKLPSVQNLLNGLSNVLRRFPFEIIFALTGTISAIMIIEQSYDEDNNTLFRILACSNLGLVIFLATTLYEEANSFSLKNKVLLKLLVLLLLIGIYFLLDSFLIEANAFRFGFLAVGFHLLVSFAPFIRSGSVDGFWEYNKVLFIRILMSGLYSGALFAGLSIAVASTDALFNLNIHGKTYGYLFCVVAGIFNTLFFLAGIPSEWKDLEKNQAYPRGLKIFTQYVLIPLATVYLGILLAYEVKVIVEWSLPKGIVSTLVLGYAVYGILSILLVYPIRLDTDNQWIRVFSKWFYLLLIPLIVLLTVAVWIRVEQYGITESRYILIVLSLWLTGITIYFLVSKQQNIKIIPISLCIVCLLSVTGPQSATSISQRAQLKRLILYFESHNAFENGKFIPITDNATPNDGDEILRFILNRYGVDPLKEYLSVNLDSLTQPADTIHSPSLKQFTRYDMIQKYLGLEYTDDGRRDFFTGQAKMNSVPIDDFHHLIRYQFQPDDSIKNLLRNTTLTLQLDSVTHRFDLILVFTTIEKGESVKNSSVLFEPEVLSVVSEDKQAKLYFNTLTFRKNGDRFILQHFDGFCLIRGAVGQ
jgi:hypothetical protein